MDTLAICQWASSSTSVTRYYYVASVKPGSQYDTGADIASVASSLVHNMTLELT